MLEKLFSLTSGIKCPEFLKEFHYAATSPAPFERFAQHASAQLSTSAGQVESLVAALSRQQDPPKLESIFFLQFVKIAVARRSQYLEGLEHALKETFGCCVDSGEVENQARFVLQELKELFSGYQNHEKAVASELMARVTRWIGERVDGAAAARIQPREASRSYSREEEETDCAIKEFSYGGDYVCAERTRVGYPLGASQSLFFSWRPDAASKASSVAEACYLLLRYQSDLEGLFAVVDELSGWMATSYVPDVDSFTAWITSQAGRNVTFPVFEKKNRFSR